MQQAQQRPGPIGGTARALLMCVVASCHILPARAQLAPLPPLDSGIQRPGDDRLGEPRFLEEPREPRLVPRPAPQPPADAPLSAGPRFVLERIVLEGNTVFSDEALGTVAEPYLGRSLGTLELQRLRRDLSQYYVDRGYINSGAVLPDQKVEDGAVRFVLVEGALDEIVVSGNERLSSEYVSSRLLLDAGPPLNIRKLGERMEIMLEDPAIDRLDASLGPGAQSGQSRLKVEVQESNAMVAAIRYGNSRPPSIGADSLRIDLLLRSLTGHGEAVSFYFERTSGLFERSARLELPLNARDTRLLVRYRGSTSEVVEAPFDLLDIESEARDIHVGLQHPIHRAVGERLDVGVGLDVRSSETSLAGIPFSFSPGVQNGNSDVTVIRATQSWFERKPDQVVALRSMLSFGIDALGATINPGPLPDGRYFAWLGQAQWARRLTSRGDQIIARGDTQLTPDKLLPLEKFNIGGARTVRGYRENQLVRDSGYAVSLEGRIALWRRPLPQIGLRDLKLEVAPFVDAGQSWDTDGETDDLASIGVGLRLQADGRALASVYFAHALIDAPAASGDDLQDDGIHFEVQANLSW